MEGKGREGAVRFWSVEEENSTERAWMKMTMRVMEAATALRSVSFLFLDHEGGGARTARR